MRKLLLLSLSILLVLYISGCKTDENYLHDMNNTEMYTDDSEKTTDSDFSANIGENSFIDKFIIEYNKKANEKFTFLEDFDVKDKNSGHYRTEFRLPAYENAIGKSFLLGETVVDIVSKDETVRIYSDTATLNQVIELVQYASPIIDNQLDDKTLSETIEYIREKKEANGYYYGGLGLVLLGNDVKGYEIMINNDSVTTSKNQSREQESQDNSEVLVKYKLLKENMTYDDVVKILGSEGEHVFGDENGQSTLYQWKCEGFPAPYILVTFSNGKLYKKDQVGLE